MRLLLTEDDAMIGQGLKHALSIAGFVIDWVVNANEADLAMQTTCYDMLLLDLGLPGQSGNVLLQRLRQQGKTLPVIILTAKDGLADRIAGLNAGADDYMVKPFASEELVARIRAVSRRQSGQASNEIHHGKLRIDPVKHQIWLDNQLIKLTAREFRLVHELARSPGAVISRERLEDHLYGWGEEVGSNTIEVHICNLRKKLGSQLIRTVRGVGYRIGEA